MLVVIGESDFKIVLNLILATMGMISCVLSYNSNEKEEIFIISLMYTIFGVDTLASKITGYLNDPSSQYFAILTSFIRILIVYISISKWNKVKIMILNNKAKSICIIILMSILSIIIEYYYMLPYNNELKLFYKNYDIILAVIYFFITIRYFKKSIIENDYIYGVIAVSTLLLSIKCICDLYYYSLNYNKEVYLIGYATIILSFIVYIAGLFVELNKSTKINRILEEQSKLSVKIIDENKHSNVIVCDENYNIKYKNKKATESLHAECIVENMTYNVGDKFELEKVFENEVNLEEVESEILLNKTYRKDVYLKSSDTILDFSVHLFEINNKNFKVVLVKDNSDKYNLDKTLLEYEIIKREEVLKNEFFSNISHELRTPLNVIYSTKQLLDISTSRDNFNDTYMKYSDILDINCKRMMRLIDNIVDTTKLDVGLTEPTFKNYNIVNVVEDMTLSVANYAKSKEINIIFDTEVEELNIKLDLDMLERIILNLLSNAIKFSNEKSTILVEIFYDNQWAGIKIIDNGIGIDPDIQHKIFNRFVKGDKSIRRKTEGSGIGLSLVKSFVEIMDGKITVKSDGKTGSEFIVMLPNQKISHNNSVIYNNYNLDAERVQLEFSDIYELFDGKEKCSVEN
ncbi:MAG: HAMP domain-containing sensor histidine kinase [Terrisporobacter sp.]